MVDNTLPGPDDMLQAIADQQMAGPSMTSDPGQGPVGFVQAEGPAALGVEASRASMPRPDAGTLEMMLDLPLDVTVELGRTSMQLGEALALRPGAIIELDRLPGEPLDMHVNNRLVARGEVVVINDALGLRITEMIGKPSD